MKTTGLFGKDAIGMRERLTSSLFSRLGIFMVALSMVLVLPLSALAAEDRLVVEDAEETTTFSVKDDGTVYTGKRYLAQSISPGFWLDETGTGGGKGAFFVQDNNTMQVQRRAGQFGAYEASIMLLEVNAPGASFTIRSSGNVGFGRWADTYPLEMKDGAYCDGMDWVNASSREYKQDIQNLTSDEAMATLTDLNPVKFSYKKAPDQQSLGFIAEDVPELVATKDRKGMSSMDVVAVLTKVVQEQQKTIAELTKKIDSLERLVKLERTPTFASATVD